MLIQSHASTPSLDGEGDNSYTSLADTMATLTKEEFSTRREEKQLCFHRIHNQTHSEGNFCNATWDGYLCWDMTSAGEIVKQHCPYYLDRINHAAYATRTCLEDGTWKLRNGSNSSFYMTNWSACFERDPSTDFQLAHLPKIQLMSEIGYGISLAALIVAVIIIISCKRLHCKSNTLHVNLFLAFIMRGSAFLIKSHLFVEGVGLEKDIIRGPGSGIRFKEGGSHWECKLLVTFNQYALSSSMMWIFMEGLYLHMLVHKTIFTDRNGVRIYLVIGWLAPLLYIIPWIIVRIFLDDKQCWTQYEENLYQWVIKGPIVSTILINFIFFVDIIRVLCKRMRSHSYPRGSSNHLRKLSKFALVLIPLFGIIYIGFAAFPQRLDPNADIIYLYCEMSYNSIQGFILALLFCFLNEEVHNEIRRLWYRRRFDWFKSTFTSSWRKASNLSKTSNLSRGTLSTAVQHNDQREANPEGDSGLASKNTDKRARVSSGLNSVDNFPHHTCDEESYPLNSNYCEGDVGVASKDSDDRTRVNITCDQESYPLNSNHCNKKLNKENGLVTVDIEAVNKEIRQLCHRIRFDCLDPNLHQHGGKRLLNQERQLHQDEQCTQQFQLTDQREATLDNGAA